MIVPCHGITKFPDNDGNYAMVLNNYDEGNLRDYLRNNHSKKIESQFSEIYVIH